MYTRLSAFPGSFPFVVEAITTYISGQRRRQFLAEGEISITVLPLWRSWVTARIIIPFILPTPCTFLFIFTLCLPYITTICLVCIYTTFYTYNLSYLYLYIYILKWKNFRSFFLYLFLVSHTYAPAHTHTKKHHLSLSVLFVRCNFFSSGPTIKPIPINVFIQLFICN